MISFQAGAPVKKHLELTAALVVLLLITFSCRSAPEPQAPTSLAPLPGQSFVKQWQADLTAGGGQITELHLRDTVLVAYTKSNNSYWLSAAGGQLLAMNQ